MVDTKEKYSITQLSKLLEVTDHTLRFYEKEFNLPIPRDSRGRRYYTTELVNIFKKIKSMRDKGMEISLIKKMLFKTIPDLIRVDGLTKNSIEYSANGINEINNSLSLLQNNIEEISEFLRKFDEEVYTNISSEIHSSTIQIISKLNENMETLSTFMENNTKLLDYKLEKHFNKVDRALSEWRNKNKGSIVKQLVQKLYSIRHRPNYVK